MTSPSLTKRKRIRYGIDDITVASISYLVAGLFALLCFIPFVYVLVYSFTPYDQYLLKPFNLIPSSITFVAYRDLLRFRYILTGYRNTIFISFVGTALSMLLLVITAYPTTKKHLKGRNFYLTLWIITMFFSGGMIPNYIVVRATGLLNSWAALVIPSAINAFNLILMKNFLRLI